MITSVLQKWLKRLAWLLFALCLFVVCLVALVWALGFQSQPLVSASPVISKAQLVQQITQARVLPRTLHGDAMHLTLPTQQINALLSDLALRSTGGRATLKAAPSTIELFASVPTSRTPVRRWLPHDWVNVQAKWHVSASGQLQLQHAQWGRIPLPTGLVNGLFDMALAHYKLRPFVDIALQSIQAIEISPTHMSARWQWRPDLKARTFAALMPASEIIRIQAYQQALVKQMQEAEPTAKEQGGLLPMLTIFKPMFRLAQERTLVKQMHATDELPPDQIPIHENRAALLVMAMHAMQIDLSTFIPQAKDWPKALPYPLTLRGRVDFAQHYLLSALIASGVGGRVADLIGIYKEQADKVAGSGFSFNDIAADRAGVRFGQQARQSAQHLQSRVQQGEDEDFFMPDVSDMPQFLTASEFSQRYSGANLAAYHELLNLIDLRVSQLGVLH